MKTFIVHIKRHCGWYTTTGFGDTFEDAAIQAVIKTSKEFGLDLDEFKVIPKFVVQTYKDEHISNRVEIYWDQHHAYMFGLSAKPGDYWWGEDVHEGSPGDCDACGGTGSDFYNSWKQCWSCGDRELDGKSSGKRKE